MGAVTTLAAILTWLASTHAIAYYPPIPEDETTPVQQRLAYHAPDGMHLLKMPSET